MFLMNSNVLFFQFYFVRITSLYKKKRFPSSQRKQKKMSTYNFQVTIASWSNAKINEKVKIEIKTNQSSIAIDPYTCGVKAKEKYFDGWKTVGHNPREVSRYIYIFIKKENGKITGNVKSLNH